MRYYRFSGVVGRGLEPPVEGFNRYNSLCRWIWQLVAKSSLRIVTVDKILNGPAHSVCPPPMHCRVKTYNDISHRYT